jgi:hypothetical protein
MSQHWVAAFIRADRNQHMAGRWQRLGDRLIARGAVENKCLDSVLFQAGSLVQ